MTKRFKKGAFVLAEGVTDPVEFEKPIEAQLMDIIAWAEKNRVDLAFGTTEDDTYICEYRVVAQTNQLCQGYVIELKAMLKKLFPKAYRGHEFSGHCFG